MNCVQGCVTFLWGGAGIPMIDGGDGDCSCACGSEGWSNHNILGMASCVPTKAHTCFGAAGLALSVTGLCHSAYHFKRQVEFHKNFMAASTSHIERCRRNLHIIALAHGCVAICYFSLVLALEDYQLWASVILLAGVSQMTSGIIGILTTRMWIYTNDQRLMQETPEILALSTALEQPAGQYVSCGVSCTGGIIAGILAAARHPQAAIKVASVWFICVIVAVNAMLRVCGTSLVRTIDNSIQRSLAKSGVVGGGNEKGGDSALWAARKKIKTAMSCCAFMAVSTTAQLLFAIFSKYGMIAPLVFFCCCMGFGPSVWSAFNIQLHAGRSRQNVSSNSSSRGSVKTTKAAINSVKRTPKSSSSKAASRARLIVVEPRRIVPSDTPDMA